MSEIQQSKFEGYTLVEIMGHQRVAGYVTTEAFGSVVMFRIVQTEVPPTDETLEADRYIEGYRLGAGSKIRVSRQRAETYVGAGSVYRMTPCTEAEATKMQPTQIEVIERVEPTSQRLEELAVRADDIDNFRATTEAKIEAIRIKYADELAQETEALRGSLAERIAEYEAYVSKINTDLDAFGQR